jgi:DNA integrity scanning protein DisA with diadenylate cyclase activity
MKNKSTTDLISFRAAIRTAARVARRRAFRKGFPVAISKNGKVVFVYKDNREVIANSSVIVKSK